VLDLNDLVIRRPAATFYARAEGESMRDAGIFDGDLLVVDRSLKPDRADIVVAVLNGCLAVKRLRRAEGRWFLVSDNPAYAPIPVSENDDCLIWGVVTYSLRQHCAR
jgi:DNA polymerase V